MARRRQFSFASFAAVGLAVGLAGLCLGCATSVNFGDGSGGEGGESSTHASSGMIDPPPCAMDCAQIEAPQCFVGSCNPETAQCEVVPAPKGATCDDGLFCTVGESCEEGVCGDGGTNTCGMEGDDCNDVVCDEGTHACSIVALPNGLNCVIDEDLCIVNAVCQSGTCVGAQKDCFFAPLPDVCHTAVCEPETGDCVPTPGNDGAACPDDGDLCKVSKTCAAGLCQGGQPKDCSLFTNACNNGLCDSATGACFGEPANDGAACDDVNSCTTGETCLAGACSGGAVVDYIVYFSETFASNAAGWTLGQEWQIGPAVASVGAATGFQDPGQDHTLSADNGIAGVVIGGYADKTIHPQYYLVSPVINTDVMGPVYLEFWRFLNSDYTPYMKNTLDVFDGVTWQKVWETGSSPGIADSAWTQVSYDLTAYKGPMMQIRFGFEIGSSGVFTVSSWNVDDVVIGNAVCN